MTQEMNAKPTKLENVKAEDLVEYDLIDLESGIYGSKFHKIEKISYRRLKNENKI